MDAPAQQLNTDATHDTLSPQEMATLPTLQAIASDLEGIATERVQKRNTIEHRWLDDLLQYHGRYSQKMLKDFKDQEVSEMYINYTRPKTDAMAAKLMDLLFPTDDRNWGIKPTPVPTLIKAAEQAAAMQREMEKEAKQAAEMMAAQAGGQQVDPQQLQAAKQKEMQAQQAKQAADKLRNQMQEATLRSELMAGEIEDQLKQSQYHAAMRDVIEQACKLGTGVSKGPVTGDRMRRGWRKKNNLGEYELQMTDEGNEPGIRHCDVWGFYPDMDVPRIEDSEGVFELHMLNKKGLRALAQSPGFSKDAIRRLLKLNPETPVPWWVPELRQIGASNFQITTDFFHVWEYSGPLEPDQLQMLAQTFMPDAIESGEIDPIEEVNACVWFCQGEVVKFALYPYDSGENIYSVFCLSKDEYSIFGEGVPSIIRDPQRSLNAGWRAMMDNASIGSGPQIIMDRSQVKPVDGEYKFKPRKFWWADEFLKDGKPPFMTFDVPMHQEELANIVFMSQKLIDDMAAMPQIAQGEQGTSTKTMGGMTILMNSANVVFRRVVKNFDDDMTTPNIRRFYDWNMQYNKREEIKGDYEVDARGSSVLLVREMQAQNLMAIALQLGAHPVFGPMLKNRAVLRKLFQAHMIPADEVVLSDDEIDAILMQAQAQQEAQAKQQAEQESKAAEIKAREDETAAKVAMAEQDNATKRYVAELQYRQSMELAAAQGNIKMDEAAIRERIENARSFANLRAKEMEIGSKERQHAAELAMTEEIGPSGGGNY
jgi:hypothetical protein